MGFDFEGMLGVVMALAPGDFYKSMTPYADPTIWQASRLPLARVTYQRFGVE
jgi:hypothetical protein